MINVYLCERNYVERRKEECAWYVALGAAFGERFCRNKTQAINIPPPTHCAYADPDAVLFVHSNGGEHLWRDRAAEETTSCHVVLVRSDGGQRSEQSSKGNLHGCFWAPEDFELPGGPRGKPEVTEFLRQMAGESAHQVKWELLQPAPTEDILALRLLCEAWLFSHRLAGAEPGDLVITATDSPSEWFAPFAKDPSIDAAAAIANRVGERAHRDVRIFFENIAQLHSTGGREASVGKLPDFAADVGRLVVTLKSACR
jgi:hypothetical protein